MPKPDNDVLIKRKDKLLNPEPPTPAGKSARLSRRFFLLKGSGAAVATGVGVATGRQVVPAQDMFEATPAPANADPVPAPPESPPDDSLVFFRPDEAALVEAITARIIPGTPEDPGAREAGVVFFIDRLLANGDGFAEPTYRQPPFAMTYEGDEPPEEPANGEPAFVWVQADELERYGFQSPLTPREAYQNGLVALDRFASDQFGAPFVDLGEEEQDQILMAMEDGEAEGFEAPTGEEFFEMLRSHTIEGMFADPIYGGNRDLVGWIMVGYPGSQRGYSPEEMAVEGTERQPQGLRSLPHFHPGRPQQGPLLPVRGSQERIDALEDD